MSWTRSEVKSREQRRCGVDGCMAQPSTWTDGSGGRVVRCGWHSPDRYPPPQPGSSDEHEVEFGVIGIVTVRLHPPVGATPEEVRALANEIAMTTIGNMRRGEADERGRVFVKLHL